MTQTEESETSEAHQGAAAHICVASPAGPWSSATGWATLGLSPSSGRRRTNAAPGCLRTSPQTRHVTSAPQRFSAAHAHVKAVRAAARHCGFCGFSLSPDASLMSRAVRIRAIRVEVKCTVLSSPIGMFIFTNR